MPYGTVSLGNTKQYDPRYGMPEAYQYRANGNGSWSTETAQQAQERQKQDWAGVAARKQALGQQRMSLMQDPTTGLAAGWSRDASGRPVKAGAPITMAAPGQYAPPPRPGPTTQPVGEGGVNPALPATTPTSGATVPAPTTTPTAPRPVMGGAPPVTGGYTTSSYSASVTPSGLMGDYQQKYNQARNDNLQRYGEIKTGYQDRYDRNMGYLENAGQQEKADIQEAGKARAAALRQRAMDRGLGGSTVQDTMLMGNDRETNKDVSRLNERLNRERIGYDSSLSGDKLGFMERRTDAYPDLGSYASLVGQLSELQASGGGGSGGGGGAGGGAGGSGGSGGGSGSGPRYDGTGSAGNGGLVPYHGADGQIYYVTPDELQRYMAQRAGVYSTSGRMMSPGQQLLTGGRY